VLDVARTPNPSNYVGRLVAQMDADTADLVGAQAMFTGAGGDQLFYEFYRWWPAADYLRLRGIDRGLGGVLMDAARLGKVSVWSAAWHALVDRFRVQPPAAPLARPWALATEALWARPRHAEAFHHPAFAEGAGLPIGKLMQVQQLTHVGGYYDPYQRAAAPELVNPLLSQPLIELCLRIPTYLLARDGRPRGLVRQAFSDLLPPEIVRRRSKGGLQELLDTVLQLNLDFARQVLLDGELVRQGLLDRRRVESALAGGPGAAPGRAGEIHMFIGVEAWLRRFGTAGRPSA
jgi:asparagine synthase (glutamine-hydrolysing)